MALRAARGPVLALTLALGACAVGPNYEATAPDAPQAWVATSTTTGTSTPALADAGATDDAGALARWWTWFEDPLLDALVEQALVQNLDVRAAQARLRLARGERRAAQAGYGPQIGAGLSAQRQQNPLPGVAPGLTFSLYEVGFDARWELDLFGRQRRRVEAARARVEAGAAERQAVMAVVCAEVVRAYWALRGADAELALAHAGVTLAARQAALAERLAAAGMVSQDAALAAQSELAQQRAALPALTLARVSAERQIEQLLGVQPGHLHDTLVAQATPLPRLAPRLLLTPAAVLRHRPDIQRAERELAAATALKAAAIADLYPRVSLAMFFGLRNTALSALTSMASKSWSGGGSLLQPLFDAGRLRAEVDIRDAAIESAVVEFERRVLEALHETEIALSGWQAAAASQEALVVALARLEQARRLADSRRAQGLAAEQEVIAADQAINLAERDLRRSEVELTASTVAVFKALGAGVPREPSDAEAVAAR